MDEFGNVCAVALVTLLVFVLLNAIGGSLGFWQWSERTRIQDGWCAAVHGGEMHGDVCVDGSSVAHAVPAYMRAED